MDSKLFALDKNYLLREAQYQLRERLLSELVSRVKDTYLTCHNPLGLRDKTIDQILSCENPGHHFLNRFYAELAGFYRFKYGKNQLEFIFDGTSHSEKYKTEWVKAFRKYTRLFCEHKHFLRAVLEGSILGPTPQAHRLIEIRLKLFLEQFFNLRIYKYWGIRKIEAA